MLLSFSIFQPKNRPKNIRNKSNTKTKKIHFTEKEESKKPNTSKRRKNGLKHGAVQKIPPFWHEAGHDNNSEDLRIGNHKGLVIWKLIWKEYQWRRKWWTRWGVNSREGNRGWWILFLWNFLRNWVLETLTKSWFSFAWLWQIRKEEILNLPEKKQKMQNKIHT